MTTEQMDWVDDQRTRRTAEAQVDMTHQAKVETEAPIPARTLAAFMQAVPANAEVTITPIEGGSQRDPYVQGYRIIATWSTP